MPTLKTHHLVRATLGVLAILAPLSALGDDKPAPERLDGVWTPVTAELAGSPYPEELRKLIQLVIEGEKYSVTVGEVVDKGSAKTHPATRPKGIDITGEEGPNKGKTIQGIYERQGDTLTVCYDLSGKERPKEFKTAQGTQLLLIKYQRKKD